MVRTDSNFSKLYTSPNTIKMLGFERDGTDFSLLFTMILIVIKFSYLISNSTKFSSLTCLTSIFLISIG